MQSAETSDRQASECFCGRAPWLRAGGPEALATPSRCRCRHVARIAGEIEAEARKRRTRKPKSSRTRSNRPRPQGRLKTNHEQCRPQIPVSDLPSKRATNSRQNCKPLRLFTAGSRWHRSITPLGTPGGAISCADLLACLFGPSSMSGLPPPMIPTDRFVLSKGHAAPALYAIGAHYGFCDAAAALRLRKLGSPFRDSPRRDMPWVRDQHRLSRPGILGGVGNGDGYAHPGKAVARIRASRRR